MYVLVACEESQRVCIEFRRLGHIAFSCDVQEQSGGHPEWHIKGDVLPLINGKCTFQTEDGVSHEQDGNWDMLIAFPPCTYLSNAGACRLYPQKGQINKERFEKGLKGKDFFLKFYHADCERIAIENPIPSTIYDMPKRSQIIQPYQFGDEYSKATCLWLKGLPELIPTKIVKPICSWVSAGSKDHKGNPRKNKGTKHCSSRIRSKTFPGIARAMAEQWGSGIINTKEAYQQKLDGFV